MKHLFVMLSLMTAAIMTSQSVTYTASTEVLANPERGFYHYKSTGVSGYAALTLNNLINYRTNEKVTLIWREFNLAAYRNTNIPQDYLTKMQTDFNTLRSAGVKAIVRFSYDVTEEDAAKAQMLTHIAQVKPIMLANEDVISSVEAGFIGGWGEWYYSNNFGTENLTNKNLADRLEVGLKIMELAPNRMIAFRTPVIQKQIAGATPVTAATAFDGSVRSRTAAHNDCFLSGPDDLGTYAGASDYTYLESQSKYTLDGGETCSLTSFSACANALTTLAKYHFNYMNRDYNTNVINSWTSNGCMTDIQKNLGYRFELLNSNVANNVLTITLQNSGYGNVFNARTAYLVLVNTTTSQSYSYPLNTNVRLWNAGTQTTITQNLALGMPNGTYQMYMNLPDSVNSTNPAYSIQLANTGTWNAANGLNDLKRTLTVTASGSSSSGSTGGTATGGSTTLPVQIILGADNIIQVANLPSPTFTVAVYNLEGKLKSTSMNISNLKKGNYIVKITCLGVDYTQQVHKRKN